MFRLTLIYRSLRLRMIRCSPPSIISLLALPLIALLSIALLTLRRSRVLPHQFHQTLRARARRVREYVGMHRTGVADRTPPGGLFPHRAVASVERAMMSLMPVLNRRYARRFDESERENEGEAKRGHGISILRHDSSLSSHIDAFRPVGGRAVGFRRFEPRHLQTGRFTFR